MKSKAWISAKIAKIMTEGIRGKKVDRKQAVAVAYSMAGEGKKRKTGDGYKRVIDNKMKDYGELDDKKKVIRIRKKPFKTKKWKKGEVIDTIVHEENHRKNLKMSEKKVLKKTKRDLKNMGSKAKSKLYARYK